MTDQTPQEANADWSDSIIARDPDRAVEYLAADFTLIVLFPALARVARTEWVAMLPEYVVTKWHTVSSEWDVVGDVAVHAHQVDMEAVVMGAARNGPFTLTDVWRHVDGRWRVWRRISTPLQSAEMPRLEG